MKNAFSIQWNFSDFIRSSVQISICPIRDHPHDWDDSSSLIPSLIIRYMYSIKTVLFEATRSTKSISIHTHTHARLHTHSRTHPYLQQPFVRFDMIQATISFVGTFAKAHVYRHVDSASDAFRALTYNLGFPTNPAKIGLEASRGC